MSEDHASNTIDPVTAERFVGEIERCDDEKLTIKMENAARQKVVTDRRNDWVEQACAAGLPRAALKLELKRRKKERELKALEEDAEADTVDLADQIRAALGDFGGTELGAAAVHAVGETSLGQAAAAAINGAAKKRGRPKKGGSGAQSDALNSLISHINDEPDVRPAFLRDKDAAAAAANAAALEGGIRQLDE